MTDARLLANAQLLEEHECSRFGEVVEPAELSLSWSAIHQQSREQLLLKAGLRMSVASWPWADFDPWMQEMIRGSYGFEITA